MNNQIADDFQYQSAKNIVENVNYVFCSRVSSVDPL